MKNIGHYALLLGIGVGAALLVNSLGLSIPGLGAAKKA